MPMNASKDQFFVRDDYLTLTDTAREATISSSANHRWAKKGLARAVARQLPLHWEKSSTLVRRSELIECLAVIRDANPRMRHLPLTAAERKRMVTAAEARADVALSSRKRWLGPSLSCPQWRLSTSANALTHHYKQMRRKCSSRLPAAPSQLLECSFASLQ